jgi:exoribonuclease R
MNPPIFEIGVHIADVSHFITPSSEVDEEAASRCTTVYELSKNCVIPFMFLVG